MAILYRIGLALAALLASAVTTATHANSPAHTPVQIPTFGFPYLSTMSDGSTFTGTISVDTFKSDGDSLVAEGHLRFGNRAVPLEFPVEVLRADCSLLELQVGPPPYRGLKDPIVILEHPEISELRQADFCRVGEAFVAGDFDELASLLNEEDLLAAGFLGGNSCPFFRFIQCGAAIAACGLVCSVFNPFEPDNCSNCFIAFGAPLCIECL